MPERLDAFYLDLRDEWTRSKLALVHSRFSTNTFPTWERAHPYRRIAHNGEINTLRGNQTWMAAREPLLASQVFGEHLDDFRPIIRAGGSDSASLDNVVDFLVAGGRSVPHVMMMLVPEAWEDHAEMPPERRAFYEYHAALVEPWDGPGRAACSPTGGYVGATLDRNGLRPLKYVVTRERLRRGGERAGRRRLRSRGRHREGAPAAGADAAGRLRARAPRRRRRDQARGRDARAVRRVARRTTRSTSRPSCPVPPPATRPGRARRRRRMRAFGYTREDLRVLLDADGRNGRRAHRQHGHRRAARGARAIGP